MTQQGYARRAVVIARCRLNGYYIIDGAGTADLSFGTNTPRKEKTCTLRVRAESAYHKYSDRAEVSFTAGK